MRLVTFASPSGDPRVGVVLGPDRLLDVAVAAPGLAAAASMLDLVRAGADALDAVRAAVRAAEDGADQGVVDRSAVTLLAPIPRPVKSVYCVGLNFRSHVEQNAAALGEEPVVPDQPLFFSKPVTAVVGPDAPIRHDGRLTAKLDYEIELAMVIGRGGRWIPEEKALDHIFGYTLVNDVSARDLQFRSSQFLYGKGQDSYCPVGPAITTADALPPLSDIELRLTVNGEVRQLEAAGNMIFDPARVVAELSRGITLEPGDIISLGTPGGCGYQLEPPRFLVPGDVVVCEATGIGALANPVVDVATLAS